MIGRFGFVGLAALFAAACSSQDATTPLPRPDNPPAKLVSFNGMLQPRATDSYTFVVSQSGYVQATLVGLGAPPDTVVALGIGTPGTVGTTTGVCQLTSSVNTTAGPTAQLIGTGIAGTLCITIRDIGNLTAPAIYTITVASS
jgi:hypothetical protein